MSATASVSQADSVLSLIKATRDLHFLPKHNSIDVMAQAVQTFHMFMQMTLEPLQGALGGCQANPLQLTAVRTAFEDVFVKQHAVYKLCSNDGGLYPTLYVVRHRSVDNDDNVINCSVDGRFDLHDLEQFRLNIDDAVDNCKDVVRFLLQVLRATPAWHTAKAEHFDMFYTKVLWHHFLDRMKRLLESFPRDPTDQDGVSLAWIRKGYSEFLYNFREIVLVWQAFPAAIAEVVETRERIFEQSVVTLLTSRAN